jgi:DNA-binding SARP family transcriptional activator
MRLPSTPAHRTAGRADTVTAVAAGAVTGAVIGAVRVLAGLVIRLVKVTLLAGILVGAPYGLATQIPLPLPAKLPTLGQIGDLLTQPVTDTLVLQLLAVAGWILWAAFIGSMLIELFAAIRGVTVPRFTPIAPVQALAGWLLTGVTAGMLAAAPLAGGVAHAPTAVAGTAQADSTINAAPAPARAAAATRVHDAARPDAAPAAIQHRVYRIAAGDWLGVVAERFLGSFDRYPQIQALNTHLIPDKVGPDGPDHIEPGWQVRLPADARDRGPRPHATGHLLPPRKAEPAPPKPAPDVCPAPSPTSPSPAPPAAQSPSPSTPAPTSPGATAAPTAPHTVRPPVRPDPGGVGPAPPRTQTPTPTADTTRPASPNPASPNPASPSPTSPSPTGAGADTAAPGTSGPDATDPDPTDPGTGAELPGGWVAVPFAAALVSAAAVVWLRRRHRYTPGPLTVASLEDPDLQPMPRVMARLRRAVRQQAPELLDRPAQPQPTVAEYAEHARRGAQGELGDHDEHNGRRPVPPIGPSGTELAGLGDLVPSGGLGLTGPGADAAARALLVAALSSGGPDDPDARGRVVIPAAALTTLLGADAVDVGAIPRLTVTSTLSEALTAVEELLIERRRLLEDYDAPGLAQLRAADPYHPPMPPVLLIAETPPAELRARLSTTLHLGEPLQIDAVLLGDWARGDTVTVAADGHTNASNTTDGRRLAVLDLPTTVELLQVLREAHTGQPAPTPRPEHTPAPVEPPPQAQPAPHPDQGSRAADPPPATGRVTDAGEAAEPSREHPPAPAVNTVDAPAAAPGADAGPMPSGAGRADRPQAPIRPASRTRRGQVRVRVLGPPAILDRDATPVPGLRHHATELLVFLTVHRAGAELGDIMEAFWPHATVRRAGERLSTEAGNLRRCLRQAAGDSSIQPVVNTGGRYHLDADLLDIDAWTLVDALRRAAATDDPAQRIAALREAVDVHGGILADGCDYDWIDQPREQHRRHGIRARLHLADLLADVHPLGAAELLVAAADLDPCNDEFARRAMRALARIGDAASIRAQLRKLRAALDDIDEEPSAETIALAAHLQHDITNAGPGVGSTDP